MTLEELKSRGREHGFQVEGKALIGVYKGYPFQVTIANKNERDVITLMFNGITPKSKVFAKMKKHPRMFQKGVKFSTLTAGHFFITYKNISGQTTYDNMLLLLDVATECLLEEEKSSPSSLVCDICNKRGCDSAAMNGTYFQPVHEACVVQKSSKQQKNAVKNQKSGNILTGIIGAFLGALIGMLPNLLAMSLLKIEFGWLYFLIPMGAYQGYKLLKGKLGGIARLVVLVSSIFGYFMQIMAILLIQNPGLGFGFLFEAYFLGLPLTDLLADNYFGLIFFGIGLVVGILGSGETNADIIKSASSMRETLQHLDGSPVEIAKNDSSLTEELLTNPELQSISKNEL
ncbi:hypothetical protein LJC01_01690 [Clostridiaceae bacterium OttesenSCG-928-D20]|nr:hypothetical protein [Clostridiaceae bacterium OttesenSCG-928-D20]